VGTGAAEVGWKCERTLVSDYKLFILFAKQVKSFHLAQDICTGPLPSETKVDLISKPGTWDRKKSKCISARNKHIYLPYQLSWHILIVCRVELCSTLLANQVPNKIQFDCTFLWELDQSEPQHWSTLQQSFLHITNRTKRNCCWHKGYRRTSMARKTMARKQTNGDYEMDAGYRVWVMQIEGGEVRTLC